MRKILLASIAVLGATSIAQAQTAKSTFDQGDATKRAGVTASPSLDTMPTLAPGQMAVRINGKVAAYFAYTNQGQISQTAGKISNANTYSYIRLYPSMDAVAANGLRYGIAAEMREDGNTPSQTSPGDQGNISSTGVVARNNTYWRRAYGYVAGDAWGTVRVGAGDSPYSLMATGAMYELGDANFCGDTSTSVSHANGAPYPFRSCAGNMYTTNKIVYLSPQFSGFDMGVAYEANTSTGGMTSGCTTAGSVAGCDALETSSAASTRRKNTADIAVRYRGVMNGASVAVAGGYLGSGKVNLTTGGSAREGLGVWWAGANVGFAGFTFQGAVEGGREDRMAMLLDGAPSQLTWQLGTTYTAGPMQIGVSYFEASRAGSNWNGTTYNVKRADRGIYSAINYGIAPGLGAMAMLAYSDSSSPNGAAAGSTAAAVDINSYKSGNQNNTHQTMASGGLFFRW